MLHVKVMERVDDLCWLIFDKLATRGGSRKATVVIPNSNRVPTTVSTGSTGSITASDLSTHLSQNAKEVARI